MTVIRRLSSHLVNQIAAGEVVERPASIVKELVENAIDAHATQIEVTLRGGGISFIQVVDNGCGMAPEDVSLSIERHATSKLPNENLFDIKTLGFRGEALPSIGAISRLKVMSRVTGADMGWGLSVEGGVPFPIEPVAMNPGTVMEVRDLFYAIPARLKFLKTPQTELNHIVDILERISLAHPARAFSLKTEHRTIFQMEKASNTLSGTLERLHAVMENEFRDNALEVNRESNGFGLQGFIGVPTLNRVNAQSQYFYVNGRPVRDKIFSGSVRAVYRDLLSSDRYPMVGLFLTVPWDEVDINVHPAKAEVRFRDPGFIRHFVVDSLTKALSAVKHAVSTHVASHALSRMEPAALGRQMPLPGWSSQPILSASPYLSQKENMSKESVALAVRASDVSSPSVPGDSEVTVQSDPFQDFPLGMACAQVHGTYIISQSRDGLVIVDQHAAHERLVYEHLKNEMAIHGIKRQVFLIPEVVELKPQECDLILAHSDDLCRLGMVIEVFGPGAVIVREMPAILQTLDTKSLVRDLAHEMVEHGTSYKLSEKINEVCSLIACHGSTRAGRKMSLAEMNDLLRAMESTPYSGQCNHGRPTHIVLKLKDIETLFGRR